MDANSRSLYVTLKGRSAPQINHTLAAILLLATAGSALLEGHHMLWALAEVAVALGLIISVVRDIHRKRTVAPPEHVHQHIGWVEVITGLFIGVEAYSRTLGPHHVSFVVLAFLPAFMLVAMGLFEPRLARRFFIRADDAGLTVRLGRRARFAVPWSDISDLQTERGALLVRSVDGSARKIALRALWQSSFVRDWILSRAGEHGVVSGPTDATE